MFDQTSRNSYTYSLSCRKVKLVERAAITLVLRFGGLVMGAEICALKLARCVMRDQSLTLIAYRKMRISALLSCLLSLAISYPSLSLVGAQVKLVPEEDVQEISFPMQRLQILKDFEIDSGDDSSLPVGEKASLVRQQAEQDIPAVAQNVEQKLWPDFGGYNDNYEGLAAFGGDDILGSFVANGFQLVCHEVRKSFCRIEQFCHGDHSSESYLLENL